MNTRSRTEPQEYPLITDENQLVGDEFYWLNQKGTNQLMFGLIILGSFSTGREMIQFEVAFEIYNVYGPVPKPKLPNIW